MGWREYNSSIFEQLASPGIERVVKPPDHRLSVLLAFKSVKPSISFEKKDVF